MHFEFGEAIDPQNSFPCRQHSSWDILGITLTHILKLSQGFAEPPQHKEGAPDLPSPLVRHLEEGHQPRSMERNDDKHGTCFVYFDDFVHSVHVFSIIIHYLHPNHPINANQEQPRLGICAFFRFLWLSTGGSTAA